jgi:branched-chain amino acid transport system substrate-binding protein
MKRSNKFLGTLSFLAAGALLIAACGPAATTVAPAATEAPTAMAATEAPTAMAATEAPAATAAPTDMAMTEIKIAFFGPLTGVAASLGQEQLALARLAVTDFNTTMGGSHYHATLVEEDTDITPDKAVPVCQKDADDATILAVVGPSGSGQVKACADILEKAGLSHVSGSATNPALSTGGYKTFFRVVPNDDVQGDTDGNFIADNLKAKKVYILDDKEAYGTGLSDIVEKILKAKNVTTERDGVNQTDTDFSALVTKIKTFAPDVVFFAGQAGTQGATLAKQLVEQGVKVPVFGGDGFYSQKDYIDAAGGATEGSYASVFFPDIRPIASAADLVKAADAAFPSWGNFGAATYVATTVVLEAAAAAGDAGHLDRAGVTDALSKTDTKVFGLPIKFTPTGEVDGASFVISQVTDSKFKQIFP